MAIVLHVSIYTTQHMHFTITNQDLLPTDVKTTDIHVGRNNICLVAMYMLDVVDTCPCGHGSATSNLIHRYCMYTLGRVIDNEYY